MTTPHRAAPPVLGDVLARSPLFEGLDAADAIGLAGRLRFEVVPRGTCVFCQDDPDDGTLYVVTTGRVVLTRRLAAGVTRIVDVHGPSAVFGELSLVDGLPRETTATALVGSELAQVRREDIRDWLASTPSAAARIEGLLARRLRKVSDGYADVALSASSRVARGLLELALRFGSREEGALVVDHGLTQAQLAEYAGTSRESLNRQLRAFERRGWLQRRRRGFVVTDEAALRRRGDGRTAPARARLVSDVSRPHRATS